MSVWIGKVLEMTLKYIKELRILMTRKDNPDKLMDAVNKGLKSGSIQSVNVNRKSETMSGDVQLYEIVIGYYTTQETEALVAGLVLFDGDMDAAKGYKFL